MKYLDQSYHQLLLYNRQIPSHDLTNITIVSNSTLESVFTNSLQYILYEELSIASDIRWTDFTFISGATLPPHALESKLIIMNFDLRELLVSSNSAEEIRNIVLQYLHSSLTSLRMVTPVPIIWLLPEATTNRYESEIIKTINNMILTYVAEVPECYVIDITNAVLATGKREFYDERSRYAFQFPYTFKGCIAISQEIVVKLRQMMGVFKKCIVLDCDFCLWGGILDEVGMNGISLDTIYPGNTYYAFQKELLRLHHCGVMIALCSKNNEKDVLLTLQEHPFMLIKEHHISSYRINWSNKADNIKEIAKELNISIDSMVFMDDSEFEIELVNKSLPEVLTILLDKKKPYLYASTLRDLTCFKLINLTKEDTTRNLSYEVEKLRRIEQSQYVNYDEYLSLLDMKLESEPLNNFNAARISQLTQRTNRGNLSCLKFSVQDLIAFVDRENYWIQSFKLSDKFGEYGYIGAFLVGFYERRVIIEGFYLSCRAFNRGVEKMMLDELMQGLKLHVDLIEYKYHNNGKNKELKHIIQQYIAERGKNSDEE